MSHALKSSKFIFMASKSYYKRFLLPMVLVIVLAAAGMQSSHSSPAYVCAFLFLFLFFLSVLLCVYPFYACDKVPQVFSVLPQRRVDLVRGFYLNFLLFLAGDLLVGLAVLLALHLTGVPAAGFLFILGLMSLTVSLIIGVEMPIAFQVGFAKIQILFNVIYMAIGFLPAILIRALHQEKAVLWLLTHRARLDNPLYFGGCILTALLLLAISYRVSLAVYQKKDI